MTVRKRKKKIKETQNQVSSRKEAGVFESLSLRHKLFTTPHNAVTPPHPSPTRKEVNGWVQTLGAVQPQWPHHVFSLPSLFKSSPSFLHTLEYFIHHHNHSLT